MGIQRRRNVNGWVELRERLPAVLEPLQDTLLEDGVLLKDRVRDKKTGVESASKSEWNDHMDDLCEVSYTEHIARPGQCLWRAENAKSTLIKAINVGVASIDQRILPPTAMMS